MKMLGVVLYVWPPVALLYLMHCCFMTTHAPTFGVIGMVSMGLGMLLFFSPSGKE